MTFPATDATGATVQLLTGAETQAALSAVQTAVSNLAPYLDGLETLLGPVATTSSVATIGTRAYGPGVQLNVSSADATTTGFTATEVLVHATTRCFVRAGAVATAAVGIPLEAGEKFHMRLTSGQQVHVIRDTADGVLNIVPVVAA